MNTRIYALPLVFAGAITLFSYANPSNAAAAAAETRHFKPVAVEQRNSNLECTLRFKNVASGKVLPQDYLDERFRCMPEVQRAYKSGMLKGFLYKPSNEQLEDVLRDLLSSRLKNKEELKYFIESFIDFYNNRMAESSVPEAITIPGFSNLLGQRIPQYISFEDDIDMFTPPAYNNDADVSDLIRHELKHVKDAYNGITLGNIHLTKDMLSSKELGAEFLKHLLELRAEYNTLSGIFEEIVKKGKHSVSKEHLFAKAVNYAGHRHYIKNKANTDLEQKVRDLQLKESKGLIPKIMENKGIIYFDLFGAKGDYTIEVHISR